MRLSNGSVALPPVSNRSTAIEQIKTWMLARAPTTSVDKLLSQPIDAMLMSLYVLQTTGAIGKREALRISGEVEGIRQNNPAVIKLVNETCNRAMNGRKHKKIRTARPQKKGVRVS